MNVADAHCLISAFERIPPVVVESHYCGLPVVSAADEMADFLNNLPSCESCQQQVVTFTARKVLAPVYQYYRNLLRSKA